MRPRSRAAELSCVFVPPSSQYNAYYHGFQTLKDLRPVADMQQNDHFVKILRRLVDEHCEHMWPVLTSPLRGCCTAVARWAVAC